MPGAGPGDNGMWFDEYDAVEMTEEPFDTLEDDISEFAELDGPDIFDDSAELAETLRDVLHDDYADASNEEMQDALFNILDTMTPAEGFNFMKTLRNIGKAGKKILKDPVVGQIAKVALPAAGAALGTVVGGPLGTAVGGKLGQVAGQAFTGASKPRKAATRAKAAKTSPKGGSAAAAKLLQLTQNPDMLKSLMALALGSHGKKSIKVGKSGPTVGAGAFINLLSTLAKKASEDADELSRESEAASAYWLDSEGDYLADPADPESRAEALYSVLADAENERMIVEEAELDAAFPDFENEPDGDDYIEEMFEGHTY
jgi:hypothetical protein